MLEFILFTCMFILFAIGGFKFLYNAIQPGQMFGKYQEFLDWVYAKNIGAAKLLGACAMCFAHLIAILVFILFVFFVDWPLNWWQSIIWYLMFISIAWYFSTKDLPKDGV